MNEQSRIHWPHGEGWLDASSRWYHHGRHLMQRKSIRWFTILALASMGVACSSTDRRSGERSDANGGWAAAGGAGVAAGGKFTAGGARATGGAGAGGTSSTQAGGGTGGWAIGGSAVIGAGGTAVNTTGGRSTSTTSGVSTGGASNTGGVSSTSAVTSTVATGGVTASGGAAAGGAISGGRSSWTGGTTPTGGRSWTGGVAAGGGASGGGSGTAGAGGATALRLAWSNPLVSKRADPHVFLHSDGYYYLTATVPEYDRIEVRRASSLDGLSTAEPKVVWRKHASGAMGAHIWAPEIHFIDGAWYIYFTAGRADDVWAIRMYALANTSTNPLEGQWTERGQIVTNWDSFSLDATTFSHAGQRYYLWTQRVPDYAGTSILIARMSSPTQLTGAQVVLSWPEYDWEKRGYEVNEAPAALVKNGKVFVTYSASATDQNYCMGLLTADATGNLLDRSSWKKAAQPVFQSSSQNSQYGPGHNSFTTTPGGAIDILVYHARSYRDIEGDPLNNPDRAIRAQLLPFDASGVPVFGAPVADGPYQVDVSP